MSGDYTRFSFDPRRRFAGVAMQQGRVQLDSDWNEQGDMLRERTRLLGLDARGPAWVPADTTPDAFLVGVLPGGNLSLEPGRIYVDGRLAEIFAGEGVTYLTQPFLPAPPPLNPAVDTIVYLDLWEREVTWAEMPVLLDVALGGIDTTTRVQQVWQVRRHEQQGLNACGIDLAALFPPSAGRLTVAANAPPAPDDPCILPPNAGYRGIENRLYRIEIQRGGPLGTALFKWSRDNGSVVSRVSAIAVAGGQTRVTVNRIGRDATQRFRINDWVTLTDDHRELNGEAGQMARVVDVDEAARVVVLDRAVPTAGRAFAAPADIEARNTRLQRWDQSAPLNALDGDGLMATAAGPIALEDGIEASFSVAAPGGVFRAGDYWVFAARTADASVEALAAAPPRGIRHQYLQLAAIPAGGVPTDCRPPNATACCTFVVRPGDSIQAAIDALPPVGGCICLKAGEHVIDTPLLLRADNVTIHGESLGAIIVNARGTGIIVVNGTLRTRIHSLTLRQADGTGQPMIVLEGVEDLHIDDCRAELERAGAGIGVFAAASSDVMIGGCGFSGFGIGVWFDKGCRDVGVTGCEFAMAPPEGNMPETTAVLAREMGGPVTIDGNRIAGAMNGIIINDGGDDDMPYSRATTSRVTGNDIDISITDGPGRWFGIDAAAEVTQVASNMVSHSGGDLTGIRIAGSGSEATGNTIVSRSDKVTAAVAIAVGFQVGGKPKPLERIIVADNVVVGEQFGIGVTGLARGRIGGNLIGSEGAPLPIGIAVQAATDCIIADNELGGAAIGIMVFDGARNRISGNVLAGGSLGISVNGDDAPVIAGNRLNGVLTAGIVITDVGGRCEVTGNRLTRCGAEARDFTAGIMAMSVAGELLIESNEIMDTGVHPEPGGASAPLAYGILGYMILESRVTGNLVTYSAPDLRSPALEDRALLMMGLLDQRLVLAAVAVTFGFPVQISDNKFIGTGAGALVELLQIQITDNIFMRFERVLVSGNYCSHISVPFKAESLAATMSLRGRRCTISGNQIKATTPDYRSWHLHGMPGPFIGNSSHARSWDRLPTAGFPAPEQNFNSIG